MKTIVILSLLLFVSCNKGWDQEKKKKLYNECKTDEGELVEDSHSEDVCVCAINEFTSKISWSEYQKMLKVDLRKDEEAFFNNKVGRITCLDYTQLEVN